MPRQAWTSLYRSGWPLPQRSCSIIFICQKFIKLEVCTYFLCFSSEGLYINNVFMYIIIFMYNNVHKNMSLIHRYISDCLANSCNVQ